MSGFGLSGFRVRDSGKERLKVGRLVCPLPVIASQFASPSWQRRDQGCAGDRRVDRIHRGRDLPLERAVAPGLWQGIATALNAETVGRTLLRLLEPTAGEIIIEGNDFRSLSGSKLPLMRQRMQMIFQDLSLP